MPGHPTRRAVRFLLAFVGLFAIVAFAATILNGSSGGGFLPTGDRHVALVPLRGEITRSDDFVDTLSVLEEDDSVAAVVVRVDSPGGAVAPSQEMYGAIRRLREKKPVVASLGSVAASGGYYVASATDVVVASRGSLTGSIGVILSLANVQGLLEKVGVQAETVTAGAQKDMGSPFRPLSAEERRIFQSMADEVHEQFISDVAGGRGLDDAAMRRVATGRIFTGEQAHELGLVDELGGLHEAVAIAAERGGIEGKPRVETVLPMRGPWWWRAFVSDDASVQAEEPALLRFARALATFAGAPAEARAPLMLWRLPVVTDGLRW
jgi:protease-4